MPGMSSADASPRLRVAIVAPTLGILGGHSVQAEQLLRCWREDPKVDAWLVPINPTPPRWLRWAARIPYLRTVVTQVLYWPLLVSRLRAADVVHVFSASYSAFILSTLPAVIVARSLRRRVFVNYHSGEAPDHLARSRLARAVLRRVDRVVVPSRFLRDVFAGFGLEVTVVPNVIDLERFRFRQRQPLRPRILSTRNFEGLYDVACTLRAFAIVQQAVPAATLTLVGAGTQEQSLRALAASLELRHVTFAGRVAPATIDRYYAEAHIYVQTPEIDNMPISLLEAAASGAAVVSTDAGGVPAIVDDGVDGLLVPVGDEHAVAAAILRLLSNPGLALRLSAAARKRCEQYAWRRVRTQWMAIYADLAGRLATRPDGVRRAARGRLARLRAMDSAELAFRGRTSLRHARQRMTSLVVTPRWQRRRLSGRLVRSRELARIHAALRAGEWGAAHDELARHFWARPSRFVAAPAERRATIDEIRARFPGAADDARRVGERLVAGRFDLLGYRDVEFADRGRRGDASHHDIGVDWHYDPVYRRRAADAWWTKVNYLDPRNGDHKIVWELNRHQHWLALGRAYWLTGNTIFRDRFVAELESWLGDNPPLRGVNWTSMLELAFRGLSWVWALHLFLDQPETERPSAPPGDAPWLVDLLLGLDRQMRHIEENLSIYFSPNTHLTGEALALYVVGRVFPEFRRARRWEATGRRLLIEQSQRQVADDGGHVERSTHYHRYTLDFYLLALAIARRTQDAEAERAFAPVVARLARFARGMADGTGCLPLIGDDDAGQLMRLGDESPSDVRASLSVAASLLPGDVPADEVTEECVWMAGPSSAVAARERAPRSRQVPHEWDRSAAFPETGYYVSRSRTGDHLVVDAGAHGFLNGGHAHADALALTLSLRWQPFLIDTGTGTYTMDPAARDRFRSTAMHNTLVLDGRSQAQPAGPFHWHTTADARPECWVTNPRFDYFEGVHEAYAPAQHRRSVFAAAGDLWLVVDYIVGSSADSGVERHAAVHWHLHPDWRTEVDALGVEALHPNGLRAVLATTAPQLDIFHGDRVSGMGFCALAYGPALPCAAVRFSRAGAPPFSIVSVIAPDVRANEVAVTSLAVEGAVGLNTCAVRVARPDGVDMALFTTPMSGSPSRSTPRSLVAGGDGSSSQDVDFDDTPGARGLRFGDFCTDAAFAHVRMAPNGDIQAVSIVDGTVLRSCSGREFEVRVPRRAHSLAVAFQPGGIVEVFTDEPLPAITIDAPDQLLTDVRWNDESVPSQRSGRRITIEPPHETAASLSALPLVVHR